MPTTLKKLQRSIFHAWDIASAKEQKRIERPPPLTISNKSVILATTLDDLPTLIDEYRHLEIILLNRLKIQISPSSFKTNRHNLKVFGKFESYLFTPGKFGATVDYYGQSKQGKLFAKEIVTPLCSTFDCNSKSNYADYNESNDHILLEPLLKHQAIKTVAAISTHKYQAPPIPPSLSRKISETISILLPE
jgi:hypothetical protein